MSGGEHPWGREQPEDQLRDDLPPAETLPVDPDIAVSAEPQAPPQEPAPGTGRPRQWDVLAVIAVGGGLGSIARYGIAHAWPTADLGFPWATFVTNISGSFGLGLLMVYVLEVWPPSRYVRPFLGVGILGGYTTFSTYTVEMRHLLAGTHWSMADAYALTSLIAGLVAVWAGIAVARRATGLSVRRGPSRRDQTPSAPPPARPPGPRRSAP